MANQSWTPEVKGIGFLSAGWLKSGGIVYQVDSDDFVSIGTEASDEKLTVLGNVMVSGHLIDYNFSRFTSMFSTVTAYSGTWSSASGGLWVRSGTSTYVKNTTDNVIIGLNPGDTGEKLTIHGNVSASGDIYTDSTFRFTDGVNMTTTNLYNFHRVYETVFSLSGGWGGAGVTVNTGVANNLSYYSSSTTIDDTTGLSFVDSSDTLTLSANTQAKFAKGRLVLSGGQVELTTNEDTAMKIINTDSKSYLEFRDSGGTAGHIKLGASGSNFKFFAGGNNNIIINSNGEMSLGKGSTSPSTTPSATFHVRGDTDDYISVFESSDAYALVSFMDSGSTSYQQVFVGAVSDDLVLGAGNVECAYVTSTGWVEIRNTGSAPVSNSTVGGYLYIDSGALKYRGSSGTVTTLGNA